MSKILISGEWLYGHYQEACSIALENLSHKVIRYGWYDHFFDTRPGKEPQFRSRIAQLQNKYLVGPLLNKINNDFVILAVDTKPEIIWSYNDTHIFPHTILSLKRYLPKTIFAQYANDNPWMRDYRRIIFRHFRKSIHLFDINFYYRLSNEVDFKSAGAKRTALLRSYYIPEETYPIEKEKIEDEFRSDVVFVGHFENDGRLNLLADAAKSGANLKLFGTGWEKPISILPDDDPLKRLLPIKPARGQQYIKAICGSKIALSFLSKLNKDTYTRRNFEIPAMRAFMLSEYTDDLNSLFSEGKEAEYFRTKDELVEKIKYYLDHEDEIAGIAQAGYERVQRDGHDVTSRMKQFIQEIEKVRK